MGPDGNNEETEVGNDSCGPAGDAYPWLVFGNKDDADGLIWPDNKGDWMEAICEAASAFDEGFELVFCEATKKGTDWAEPNCMFGETCGLEDCGSLGGDWIMFCGLCGSIEEGDWETDSDAWERLVDDKSPGAEGCIDDPDDECDPEDECDSEDECDCDDECASEDDGTEGLSPAEPRLSCELDEDKEDDDDDVDDELDDGVDSAGGAGPGGNLLVAVDSESEVDE